MSRKFDLFINGCEVASTSGARIQVRHYATQSIIADVPDASADDVGRAVSAARTALRGPWSQFSPRERGSLLHDVAQLIRDRSAKLVDIEVEEVGRPIHEISTVDLPESADCFDFYAAAARQVRGDTIDVGRSYLDYTLYEPVGVVAQVLPWNFPLNLASWKVAPALAMGNAVVLKPSELTPSTAIELAKICKTAGLPDGVFNVITGYGRTAGQALVEHADVDMIAFTGGRETGQSIAEGAARAGKRASFELGGKNAMILFADCEVPAALASVLEAVFFATGQNCCAGSRLLLHEGLRERFLPALRDATLALKVGPPNDRTTQVGRLISLHHRDRVISYVRDALNSGAEVLVGGEMPTSGELACQPFLQPTVIVDAPLTSRIVQEEVFGPVLTVNFFGTEDEAVSAANATPYDLAAGVWTSDLGRAHRVARNLRAGTVWINTFNRLFNDAPFGGLGHSGRGRDLGVAALDQYAQVKNVCLSLEPGRDAWFPAQP